MAYENNKGIEEVLWKHVQIRRPKEGIGLLLAAIAIKSRGDAEKQISSVLISFNVLCEGISNVKKTLVRVNEVQFKTRNNRRVPGYCKRVQDFSLESILL